MSYENVMALKMYWWLA